MFMGISMSGVDNIAKAGFSALMNSQEPNWSIIPSSGKNNKSGSEFISEIKELAHKAALTTNKAELDYISRQRLELRAEYLSDVAPDRKMLYQQAKNSIKRHNGNSKSRGVGELTLLDFLEQAEGKISNLADRKFALAGGGTLVCPILTGEGHGANIYYQGTMVLSYNGGSYGWAYGATPAEQEKMKVFNDIYWKEYRAVKNGENSGLVELPDYLEDKSVFDAKA